MYFQLSDSVRFEQIQNWKNMIPFPMKYPQIICAMYRDRGRCSFLAER